ncbi:hypothetical protein B0H11DRAFT_1950310 [Mycena galericulata]|nr:hypothetical protein B0H11DRAFT_1950310 [Mycena galericulata]
MYVHGIAQQSDIQLLLLLLTLSHQEAVTRDPWNYLELRDPPKKYLFGSLELCKNKTLVGRRTGTSSHGGDIQLMMGRRWIRHTYLQMTNQGSQARPYWVSTRAGQH